MKVVIDRFEGEYAVVELPDGSVADMPSRLIEGGKEGDVVRIEIDGEETKARRKQIGELIGKLFETDPWGENNEKNN